ncbi:hypothetical protein [Alkalihalobacillus sp. LMS39]|uniref:hypothetical protein n=1 Tax=Alkalihalobacillus sp. LMS39 TaxID=2924032 RepID=UPI001FB40504|nr:hypothetical protein [Alkalihalobacillus sp. LMS39]UOE95207.1 hypothetical protein MM271_06185 [Alkalihalobacillus sp. LMS39]
MYEWLTSIKEPENEMNFENGELEIVPINSTGVLTEMSEVCLFFASYDVLLKTDALATFPVPNEKALKMTMEEIVPHYSDVKQIFIDGKLTEINVRCLKDASKKMVQDKLSVGSYPVIPDLYRSKERDNFPISRKLNYFEVNQAQIEPLYLKETEKLQRFITYSFLAKYGSLSLQPKGWFLEEKLKESATIRLFSSFAKRMVLVVDDKDGNVVGLDIYG